MDVVFGLSLGNFETTLAVFKSGRTEVLANERGERATPTMVTYSNKKTVLTGTSSKQSLYRNFESTAVSMLDLLEAREPDVKTLSEHLNCKVEFKDGKVQYCIPSVGEIDVKNALSHIFDQLAATAQQCTSLSPIPVVLATESNNKQKMDALRQCAKKSGFDVVGCYLSPVLSLLPYDFGSPTDTFSGHVLVYDMGTRMLRLSLIRCDEGMMRILMTCEVGGVGGVYLDDALVSVLKEEVKRIFRKDAVGSNKRVLFKLLSAAENAKHSLSSQNTTSLYIESLVDGMDFQYTLSRGKFEGVCLPIFKSFLEPLNGFLSSAELSANDIKKVVLTGGTCKVPKLQQMLRDHFSSGEVLSSVPPDHVTALGAAIQGGYLMENEEFALSQDEMIPCSQNNVLVKCSSCAEPSAHRLVPRHTPLPCRRSVTVLLKPVDSTEFIVVTIVEKKSEASEEIKVAEIKVPSSLAKESTEGKVLRLHIDFMWRLEPTKDEKHMAKSEVRLVVKDLESDWRTESDIHVSTS